MPSLTILAWHHLPPISSDYFDFSHMIMLFLQHAYKVPFENAHLELMGFLGLCKCFCRTNDYPSSKMLHNFMLLAPV